MAESRCYRFLLVEQASLPVEEELPNSLLGRHLLFRTQEWSETLVMLPQESPIDLIISVASSEPEKAFRLFTWLGDHPVQAPTLAVLPGEVPPGILDAASRVVDDFVLWPFRRSELDHRISRMLTEAGHDLEAVRSRLNQELGLTSLVGSDPGFLRMIDGIPRIAKTDGNVLITGETGTGKELCARAIHHLSRRRNFPFIPMDCAAFPEQLLENELFGHSRGAFTDARGDQKGLALLAEGGTLFLDEIDALSLPGQAKLLRFLEDRVYKPLGAERLMRANVRIVAATNRDLEACVEEKQFRADLFFRLNVFRLRMAPLRERREDIALLAKHFLKTLSANSGGEQKALSTAAIRRLTLHDWPGNVRELFNEIQRAFVFADTSQILPSHISLPTPDSSTPTASVTFRDARAQAIGEFERHYVEEVLHRHRGNITRAAREAGKERRTFGRLVKKHRIAW